MTPAEPADRRDATADIGAEPATDAILAARPEGFQRVSRLLAERGHPHPPLWLDVAARTSAEAAEALGVAVGQIAKSVVFRRKADDVAVVVVAAGDRRVDTARVSALAGKVGRADADYVKARTGFSIGGVSPLGHRQPTLVLVDRTLARFDAIWAAAGHPNGVFRMSFEQLCALTGSTAQALAEGDDDDPAAPTTAAFGA